MKNVLILEGSPRIKGNTALLAEQFQKGAEENGSHVERIYLLKENVKPCLGCRVCQGNGGVCVQKDGMTDICEKMKKADVLVFASPLYYYNVTSTLKAVMDRSFALLNEIHNTDLYLLTAGADTEKESYTYIENGMELYAMCFPGGMHYRGAVIAAGTGDDGTVSTESLQQACEMGRNI